MQKVRGFEVVSAFQDNKNVVLPKRKTTQSAGYDFASCEGIVLWPMKITLVPTGIKSYMLSNEVLQLYIRSSLSLKGVVLVNGSGIIDADYYNNQNNEGHIMFPLMNISDAPIAISPGDRIGQGIFHGYFITDDDVADGIRVGGLGSTGVSG